MILICYTFSNLLCFSWMALHSAYVHYNACKKGLQTFRLKSKCSLTLFFCHNYLHNTCFLCCLSNCIFLYCVLKLHILTTIGYSQNS